MTNQTTGLRRTAAYANWLFNPLYRPQTPSVYDLLGRDSPTSKALYLNLGYWANAKDLDQACEALVDLVGQTAGLDAHRHLVDCGFGFADQDIYWAHRFPDLSITGLNVTPSQVSYAQRRVRDAGLDDRIDLRLASATAMPLDDASADAVTALESAFHFRTREQFFREAWRILKPGGQLVTADIIPMGAEHGPEPLSLSRAWRFTASRFDIPEANAYTANRYKSLLEEVGFAEVGIRSIRSDVYAPLHAALRRDSRPLKRMHPLPRAVARLSLIPHADTVFHGMDYVVATATKPMVSPLDS